MNRSFLQLYEQELRHIREVAGEFAAEYPKIAGRLSLSKNSRDTCPDPFVERLLEGFAYLTARVQLKLDAEFPTFTQGILETVYPDYLAPGPSCSIVEIEPEWNDPALLKSPKFLKGSQMKSLRSKDDSTPCTFTTSHDVGLLPLKVTQAEYHFRNVGLLNLQSIPGLRHQEVKAAIRLRFTLQGVESENLAKLAATSLSIYLHGEDHLPSVLLETLLSQGMAVLVREPSDHLHRKGLCLPISNLRQKGFEENEAMLPASPFTFEGHRLLREYFLLPQKFRFLEVHGLANFFPPAKGREFEIIIPLKARRDDISEAISPDIFRLNCVPVTNVFRVRADRIPLRRGENEYQVIAERTRILDHEIYRVESVTGYGKTNNESQEFQPFYLNESHTGDKGAFYTVKRAPRALSAEERRFGARSKYPGSEVFLTLVDPDCAPHWPELEQLATICLCTNRHLPLAIPIGLGSTDFQPENAAGIRSIRCLVHPTPPQPSVAEGRYAWRVISHLSLNYLSLLDRGDDGAVALREMLRLYTATSDAQRKIEGIVRISSKESITRSPNGGPVSFVRGLEITLRLDEDKFAGSGAFVFAAVLEQFLARTVTLNAYTKLTYKLPHHGDNEKIYTWPPSFGKIPML